MRCVDVQPGSRTAHPKIRAMRSALTAELHRVVDESPPWAAHAAITAAGSVRSSGMAGLGGGAPRMGAAPRSHLPRFQATAIDRVRAAA